LRFSVTRSILLSRRSSVELSLDRKCTASDGLLRPDIPEVLEILPRWVLILLEWLFFLVEVGEVAPLIEVMRNFPGISNGRSSPDASLVLRLLALEWLK
jgi:hypothetical protein